MHYVVSVHVGYCRQELMQDPGTLLLSESFLLLLAFIDLLEELSSTAVVRHDVESFKVLEELIDSADVGVLEFPQHVDLSEVGLLLLWLE